MSISVKGVTKSFGTFVALHDVDLEVPAGHIEAHVVEGDEVAERLAQVANFDAHAAILSEVSSGEA